MPPFEYKPFINPYIGSISELMGKGDEAKAAALIRIGEIQARAAEQQGQAWGNAIQGLGNIASKTITDYNDPKLRMQKIELAKAEEQERLRQASTGLSSQTIPSVISTNVPGQPFEAPTVNVIPPTQRGIGSRAFENVGFGVPVRPAVPQSVFGTAAIGKTMVTPDSTVVESVGPNVSRFVDQSTKMLDVKSFQNALAKLTDPKTGQSFSLESIAARLKPLIDVNESLIDYDAKKSALDKSQQVGFGTLANSILTYVDQNPGSRITDIASVAAAAWGDRLGSDKIAAFMQDLQTLSPSQQRAKLEGLKSTAEAQMPTDNLAQGTKKVGAFGTILGQGDPKDTPLPTRASLLAAANNPNLPQVERDAAQKAADGFITEPPAATNTQEMFEVFGQGYIPLTVERGKPGEPNRYFHETQGRRVEKFPGKDFEGRPQASVVLNAQTTAALENIPDWAMTADRPEPGPESNKINKTIGLSPNGLYQAAITYIDTNNFLPVGRGSTPLSVAARSAIQTKVGAIATEAGMDVPEFRAVYAANKGALNKLISSQAASMPYLATADKNADLLLDVLNKIPETNLPALDSVFRTASQFLGGDANMAKFNVYLKSVTNEYAKIISNPNLTGVLTNEARRQAAELIPANATVSQIRTALLALKAEGRNRLTSISDAAKALQSSMTRNPTGGPDTASPTVPTPRPTGVFNPRTGKVESLP